MKKLTTLVLLCSVIAVAAISPALAILDWEFNWGVPGLVDRNGGDCDCKGKTVPYGTWPANGLGYDCAFWHSEKPASFTIGGITGQLYKCYPDMYPANGKWYACVPGHTKQPIGAQSLRLASACKSGYIYDSWWQLYCGDFDTYGWYNTNFKQTDYNVQYGNGDKNITIADIGCFLCCACNALCREGLSVTPPELNSWLRSHGGFANKYLVRLDKIVEWAKTVCGVRLGYKINLPAKECTHRSLSSWTSVKSGRHFVNICEFNGPLTDKDYTIRDPMHRTDHLTGYTGYSTSNTRSIYCRMSNGTTGAAKTSATSEMTTTSFPSLTPPLSHYLPQEDKTASLTAQSFENVFYSCDVANERDGSAEPYFGTSAISLYTESNVTLTLKRGPAVLGVSEPVILENATTGADLSCGSSLEVGDLSGDKYTAIAIGKPGTPVDVLIVSQGNGDANATEYHWTATIGPNGTASYSFDHVCSAIYEDLGPVNILTEHTQVSVAKALVTAVVPGGFYLQPVDYKLPVVFVPWTKGGVEALMVINHLEGFVENGKLVVTNFTPGYLGQEKKPACVSTGGVVGSFHLFVKLVGKVTEVAATTLTLDGTCQVKFEQAILDNLEVGQTVSIKGVWHDGIFYAKGQEQLQSYDPTEW